MTGYHPRTCDHGDKAGNVCPKPCKWLIVMPHNEDPRHACQAHLAAVILAAHEFYSLATTDPEFPVRRW